MQKIHKVLLIFCLLYFGAASADNTLLQLRMEENSFAPRMGTLNIVAPMNGTSPFGVIPDFSPLDTGLRVDAQWEGICTSNASLAGGQLTGWLLGPAVEGTLDLAIDDNHDEFRSIFGLGPGNTATILYVVLAGDFFGIPTDGIANRFSCAGGTETAEFGLLWIFLWPNATTFADKGFYVGDVFYQTEIGIQHYYLYNASRLF